MMAEPEANTNRIYWRKIFLSYLIDFAVVAILFIPSVAAPWIHPFQRPFDVNDKTIGHPYGKSDIVPSWLLPVSNLILRVRSYS